MNDLFVKQVTLVKDESMTDQYPFCIDLIQHFDSLSFEKPVSFFIGENGVGKSTFVEGLAVALGLNAEGGTENFYFHTAETHSQLHHYLKVSKGVYKPQTKFFLRAESFYNVATEIDQIATEDSRMYNGYGGKSLHACSHGESFIQLMMNRFSKKGLYILDEPEAALSPQRQLTLLMEIYKCARKGAQFFIVTHSPILLGIPDADIYCFDDGRIHLCEYEETESYQITEMFINNREVLLDRLLKE